MSCLVFFHCLVTILLFLPFCDPFICTKFKILCVMKLLCDYEENQGCQNFWKLFVFVIHYLCAIVYILPC